MARVVSVPYSITDPRISGTIGSRQQFGASGWV
jgi:hypothetical protein